MADFAANPVGTSVNPVGQGMQTLSDVMSLKQKQQALQTGQYTQQSAQATAQQDQQKNQELQALAQFTKTAAQDPKYHNPDGSLNVQKYQTDAMAAAPTYGQAYIGQMTNNANAMVDNRKALLGLSNEQRKTIGGYFGAVAANPKATTSDFMDAAEQARGVSDDPGYQKAVDRMLMSAPPVAHMPTADASSALQKHAQNIAIQTGAPNADLSMPAQSTTAAGQAVNVNKVTGARSMPEGSNNKTNPASPTVAANTGYNVGTASADVNRANEVGDLGQGASATVQLTKRVDQLATEINSGHIAAMVAKGSNYLGFSSVAQARTELQKDLGQLRGAVAGKAGSDSRAAEILEGYPSDTTPEQTIHAAMDYIRGSARQNIARNNLLAEYKKGDPTNLKGFQAADNSLVTNTNPLMHEYLALKPQERSGFYRRNFKSPQDAQDFKDSITAAQKHTKHLSTSNE